MINNSETLTDALDASFPISSADLDRLHRQLADSADRVGLLDIAYRTLDTPVGQLLLAATEQGIVRVAYPNEDHDAVLRQLSDKISSRILSAPARLDAAAAQLDEYFSGRRRTFDLPLDRRLSSGFRRTVLDHLLNRVGYGETASYGMLATLTGNPGAARAVGTACSTNPLPVIVPCHRVVRGDGSVGAYIGGSDAKRTLLTLEGAAA